MIPGSAWDFTQVAAAFGASVLLFFGLTVSFARTRARCLFSVALVAAVGIAVFWWTAGELSVSGTLTSLGIACWLGLAYLAIAKYQPIPAIKSLSAVALVLGIGSFYFFLLWVGPAVLTPQRDDAAEEPALSGVFHFTRPEVGPADLVPIRCLSGRERGFQGILFQFANDAALRELRLDTERAGDNVVELWFDDLNRVPEKVRERDCEQIDGRIERQFIEVNGRDMDLMDGSVTIRCATAGLQGQVRFHGCLPPLGQPR